MFSIIPYSRRNGNVARKNDWFKIDRFFEDFFRDPFFARISAVTAPIRADVKETDKEYIVEAELPGVNKEDIYIDLKDDVLTFGIETKNETTEENDGYIYKERQSGSYRRSFHVQNIKNEEVKASYKNGLLVITLPKAKPDTGSRRINID